MTSKKIVHTEGAPEPIGPYSQAIMDGDTVFCSGQIGIDPATGDLVSGGVAAESERAILNLQEVLAAVNCGLEDVVKATVFLRNMSDFPPVNEIYAKFFGRSKPARSTVAVSALPKGAQVEIDAIARVGHDSP